MRLALLFLGACATDAGVGGGQDTELAGDGVMSLAPVPMIFTDLDAGFSSSQDLVVTNTGTGDLTIYDAALVADPSDAFDFVEVDEDLILEAGASQSWIVSATLPGTDMASGTLRIRSNDAAATQVDVALCAYPAGYGGDMSCQ